MFTEGLLICFLTFQLVSGSGKFSMRFLAFNNPGGKGDNGNCCDGFGSFFCHSPCDHQFTICLDSTGGSQALTQCRYGRVVTGEIRDRDSMRFGSSIGGTRNPIIFSMNVVPRYVRIKIGIWDVDTNNAYDMVDYMAGNVALNPGRSSATPASIAVLRKRVSLSLNIKAYCDPGYYGPDCSVFCKDNAQGYYTCDPSTGGKICDPGWYGINCDASVDDCASNPCLNDGMCIDRHRGYLCACKDGFDGFHCETRLDPCVSEPCNHGGVCRDTGTNYTCTCPQGWTGPRCAHDVDECAQNPCQNFGICLDFPGGFECKCQEGFTGQTCDVDMNECLSNPCLNGGSCMDLVNGFHCACPYGYTGQVCDYTFAHCDSEPCKNNATCTYWFDGYNCTCAPGYTGLTCDREIDQCASHPCYNSATCNNLRTSFTCTCPSGFRGMTCEEEIDECSSFPCLNNATCIDGLGNVTCDCLTGFSGHLCEVNIDECSTGPCLNNGTCVDNTGYFDCSCDQFFTGPFCEIAITTVTVTDLPSTTTETVTSSQTSEADTASTSTTTETVTSSQTSEADTASTSINTPQPFPNTVDVRTDDVITSTPDPAATSITQTVTGTGSTEHALCFPLYFKGKVDPDQLKEVNEKMAELLKTIGDFSDQVVVTSQLNYMRDENGGSVSEVSVNVTVGGKLLQKNDIADICRRIPAGNILKDFPFQMYTGTIYPLASSSTHIVQQTADDTTIAMIVVTVLVAIAVISLIAFIIYRRRKERKSQTPELVSIDETSTRFDNQLYMQPSRFGNQLYMQPNLSGIENRAITLE